MARPNYYLRSLSTRRATRSHRTFRSRSIPKPIERIESLRPLRFRMLLGGDSADELEVVR
jgi:hypothetical protein